jgi:dolichol-phosphate mannosyltransferase
MLLRVLLNKQPVISSTRRAASRQRRSFRKRPETHVIVVTQELADAGWPHAARPINRRPDSFARLIPGGNTLLVVVSLVTARLGWTAWTASTIIRSLKFAQEPYMPPLSSTVLPPRTVVTLCTYNERENIAKLVPQVLEALPSADILVVDDSSPDGTADVVRQLMAANPRIKLLLRVKKEGLGAATLAGFQWAIDHDYDFVINMDADFSHHPRFLPALAGCMQTADVSVGSRYVPGGGISGWSRSRHFMSQGINWYSHVLLGLKTRDCSGAYRCYRISKLRELDFRKIRSRGYAFQEEFLYRCTRIGCRVVETPIVFEDRIIGQSKINLAEIVRSLRDLFLLGLDGIRETSVTRDPLAHQH